MTKRDQSVRLFEEARQVIPGGVNSPVRAWRAVGADPLFIDHASGSRIWDVDGNEYIDFIGSWGPMILGHAHPGIIEVVDKTLRKGSSFGAPTAAEAQLARVISEAMPSIEMVRLVSSGTEAAMSAIRLARGFTGRSKLIKFDGCYHGHADSLLVKAGSGAATFGVPDSAGVPPGLAQETLVAEFNDLESVERLFAAHPGQIATVILEPVVGNMGTIPPQEGFLVDLARLVRRNGALLIVDEVMTGFRLAYGGAQSLYGIDPDLTVLGKIVGGGLPLAAFGGKRSIMEKLAPLGPVYQAGTLSGNPLAVAAGIETLAQLRDSSVYSRIETMSARLEAGLLSAIASSGIRACLNRVGSMWTLFFGTDSVTNATTARQCNTTTFAEWFRGMLGHGVYLPPSQFEAAFLSLAHGEKEIDETIAAARSVMASLPR